MGQISNPLIRALRALPVALLACTALAAAAAAAGTGPAAAFKWTSLDVPCGTHPLAFEDGSKAGASPIVTWSWDFGDGATSSAQHPQHTFPAAGDYTVRLTVTDADGAESTMASLVTVSMPETPCGERTDSSDGGPPPAPRDGTDADAEGDRDRDGVRNALDNCPLRANHAQDDKDADGLGDVCDPDLDGDGITNLGDNCAIIANPGQSDADGNGVGDACDAPINLGPVVFLGPVAGEPPGGGAGLGGDGLDAAMDPRAANSVRPDANAIATASGVALAGAAAVAVTVLVGRDVLQRRSRRKAAAGLGAAGLVGAGLFSRISGEELLDSKARQTIIACVREQPGIHFRALQRAVGVGSSSVQYHLNVLLKAGYVHRHEWKGSVGYYAEGAAVMPAHETVRSETARQILGDIVTHPASTVRDVADRLSCDPSLVAYHLRQFQGAGLIDRVTQAGAQRIMPRPDAAVALGGSMQQMLAPPVAA